MEVYNLKNDTFTIENVQKTSLDLSVRFGYTYEIENDILFGSKEWFEAIDTGAIKKHTITGVISKVYMSGHNDYAEFEITDSNGKTIWYRYGDDTAYKEGRKVELVYVEQKFRHPSNIPAPISKRVVEIHIDQNS